MAAIMKRAATKALSHSIINSTRSFLSRALATHLSSSPSTINQPHLHSTKPPCIHIKSCPKSPASLYSNLKNHKFWTNPSHNFNTQAETPMPTSTALSTRRRKTKEKADLEEAFESATKLEDMVKAFEEMEACFDERELGLASLKLGLKLDQEGEDPEKVLSFATRALKALDSGNKVSLPIAMTLQLLGSANSELKRFNDSLGYLNRANRVLGRLEEDGSCDVEDIRPILHAVHLELANVKTAMGRREEAIGNLRKSLEIKESILGKDHVEIGKRNKDLAEALVGILNFREALPYCSKALEIHKGQLGPNSAQVAQDRLLLGVIYTGMDEHEKALDQNRLAQKTLKNWGLSSDLLRAEISAANMEIALGRYDAAINTLKAVVQQTEKDSENRALVFISMAKAFVNQDKFGDSRRCLETAAGVLSKKESSKPLEVAEAYMDISMQYEVMNEFEKAISLLKKALALLDKVPQEQHSVGSVSARIGWLLLLIGKVAEAIPYLESAAETLKESFGPQHFGIGYIYNNLGAAYLELDRPQSAAQMFAVARDIMDVSLGSHHSDSIEAIQNLSKAYAAMGSYVLAIEFQQQAVNAWEGHGSSAENMLKEARRVLKQLKMKASGESSYEVDAKALPLPHNSDPSRSLQPNLEAPRTKLLSLSTEPSS